MVASSLGIPAGLVPAPDSASALSPSQKPESALQAGEFSPNPSLSPVPEDEVKVQADTPPDGIMIYRFVNQQSGALILQVPTEQVLSVAHGIEAQLQRVEAQVASAGQSGGNSHGH